MPSIIQLQISESDGGYVAEGVDIPIVTEASTLDELVIHIRETVALIMEGDDPARTGTSKNPSVLISFELPSFPTPT